VAGAKDSSRGAFPCVLDRSTLLATVVASLIAFSAATALWMAIGRWIWKQGRRRRGITAHADGNLPELRR
jgi:hypothetical protein